MSDNAPWQRFLRTAGRAWHRFRRWRRSRPFWGGVFLVLAGLELFLSINLDLLHIDISFGPEGFVAFLLPTVIILCGLLVWFTPQHRHFYGIIGTLTAVYSLLGLNLGGWFVGMLLGIVGGALAFAWTPAPEPTAAVPTEPAATEPATTEPVPPEPRANVAAILPLLLTAALAAPQAVPSQLCLPLLCPDPPSTSAPGPSPDPPPGPSAEPSTDPDPDPTGGPTPSPGPEPTEPAPSEPGDDPTPTPSLSPVPSLPPPDGQPLVAAEPAVLTADRLDQEDFLFVGITELPSADGPIDALQFSFSRAVARGFTLTAGDGDAAARITADPLVLAGDVTFYASRFSGRLLGGVRLDLTPGSPLVDLLQLVDIPLRVFFTDVDLGLVFTRGVELAATGFALTTAAGTG